MNAEKKALVEREKKERSIITYTSDLLYVNDIFMVQFQLRLYSSPNKLREAQTAR